MSQKSDSTVRAFKVGDWVKLNPEVEVTWYTNQTFGKKPPSQMSGTVFVVRSVCEGGDCYVTPHPIFSGLFRETEYDLYLGDTEVFDFYYPEELVLVESIEDED